MTESTHLGSIVGTTGGTEEESKVRIDKARVAFKPLKKVWNAREISRRVKMRIFNSNVKAVLFYGPETWYNHLTRQENIVLHKQVPIQNHQNLVAQTHQQPGILAADKPAPSCYADS